MSLRERVLRQLDGRRPGAQLCRPDPAARAVLVADGPGAGRPTVLPLAGARGLVRWGELVVDRAGHRVTWRGEPLPLTPTERELLTLLIGPPLVVWSYEQLFAAALERRGPRSAALRRQTASSQAAGPPGRPAGAHRAGRRLPARPAAPVRSRLYRRTAPPSRPLPAGRRRARDTMAG